jgi:hypothetical protein
MYRALSIVLLTMTLGVAGCTQRESADLVLSNGKIWTVDGSLPVAQAVAVKGNSILAVGSADEMRKFIGRTTKVVDLHGRLLLPGFIDNHTHFIDGGFQLQNVDLRSAATEEEFAWRIGERVQRYPGRWITGGDWDHENWPGGKLPTRELIDSLSRKTPVFVSRYDGHMALANSQVLTLAGITKDTPDPPGGMIVRDPRTGEPTGILKDEAMSLVWIHIPDHSESERLEAATAAFNHAKMRGLTSIQDISSESDVKLYSALRNQHTLTARMYCRLPIAEWKGLAAEGIRAGTGDEWVKVGSLKAFADGSLGSSTALFFAPYTSDPSTNGLPMDILQDGRLEQWAREADSAGLQLSVHAIGDSANSAVLDIFERIIATNPAWDRRFRIEHAQHIHPKDFERFARLGVIASVQPYHAIDDGRWAEGRIGHERCATTYPFKTFLDNNVMLCFGSDWTVAPLDPLLGIYAAVTRQTLDGKHPDGWFPEQKITVEDAIRAYTIHCAYAAFEDEIKGSITPGKLADFVVLSDDILTIEPVSIKDVVVDMTVVGGTVVYERIPRR